MSYKSLGRRKGLKTKFLCLLTVLTVMIGSMPMTALGLSLIHICWFSPPSPAPIRTPSPRARRI